MLAAGVSSARGQAFAGAGNTGALAAVWSLLRTGALPTAQPTCAATAMTGKLSHARKVSRGRGGRGYSVARPVSVWQSRGSAPGVPRRSLTCRACGKQHVPCQ